MICFVPALLLLMWYFLRAVTRFPERTVRDVYPFFHRIESEILIDAFHPENEEQFRVTHVAAEFKKWQYRRIHLAIHLCRHVSANSRLLHEWAKYERNENWLALPDKLRDGMRMLQVSAMQSRTAAFFVRFRLRLWLLRINLLPFLRIPSFRTLASHSHTLISFYGKAETLAEALSLTYGDDQIYKNMLAVLGMVELELDRPDEH
jgi:hypothetical protein